MLIERLLTKKGISLKHSGVPYMTINDVCNGKVRIERCSGETLYRIAKALNISIEELIEGGVSMEYRCLFEIFKSNVCHRLKGLGSIAPSIPDAASLIVPHTNMSLAYHEIITGILSCTNVRCGLPREDGKARRFAFLNILRYASQI